MKALISLMTFVVLMGIGLLVASWTGYFPIIVAFYILFIILSLYFSKKWDIYVIHRRAKKLDVTPFECVKNVLPEFILYHCGVFRGNEPALKNFLRECIRRELLNKACADIVFSEYKDERPAVPIGQNRERQNPENTYRNY